MHKGKVFIPVLLLTHYIMSDQSSMETTVIKLEILGYKEFKQRG